MYFKYYLCLFVLISTWSALTSAEPLDVGADTACGELGDCPSTATNCGEICSCNETDVPTSYDNTTKRCEVNITALIQSLSERYNTEGYDISMEGDMATKLTLEADQIFQGIIVAALIFISCASICVFLACIYCCEMNYSDYRLKKNIKQLAKKMGTNPQLRRPAVKSPRPISESCNVVVEDAGVFCV